MMQNQYIVILTPETLNYFHVVGKPRSLFDQPVTRHHANTQSLS